MKTIILSIPYTMSARNILRSDIFRILKSNFKVVVLTPLHADNNFRQEFATDNVVIKDLPRVESIFYKLFRRTLDIVEGYYFTRKTRIETLLILRECLKKTKPVTYWVRTAIGCLFSPLLGTLRTLQGSFLQSSYYDRLFSEYDPVLVFLTHPIAIEEFAPAFYAKRLGIKLAAMIHSWDNVTSKSGIRTVTSNRPGRMLPLDFDKVVVWNDIIREELTSYYGYAKDDVSAFGVPQFDSYYNYKPSSRKDFFKKIGADPEKKLILYAAGSSFLLPKQDEVIDIIVKAITDDKFAASSQLLIRAHPGTDMTALRNKFSGCAKVLFSEPGIANAALRCSKGWKPVDGTQAALADILSHCDVTVNVSSTMSLDAAVFDKPIVCVGLDGYKNLPYHKSLLKHYDFTHYKYVMDTGGVKLAKTPEELITYINDYLLDPSFDSSGRRKIREGLCYNPDGKAGERIGRYICELVGAV